MTGTITLTVPISTYTYTLPSTNHVLSVQQSATYGDLAVASLLVLLLVYAALDIFMRVVWKQ